MKSPGNVQRLVTGFRRRILTSAAASTVCFGACKTEMVAPKELVTSSAEVAAAEHDVWPTTPSTPPTAIEGPAADKPPATSKDGVVTWRPKEPVTLYRIPTPDEIIDGQEWGQDTFHIDALEIRFDKVDPASNAITLRLHTDRATFEQFAKKEWFHLEPAVAEKARALWDETSPIDVQLRFDAGLIYKLTTLPEELEVYYEGAAPYEPNAAAIAQFASNKFEMINMSELFVLELATQRRADGSTVTLEESEIKALAASAGLGVTPTDGTLPGVDVKDRPTKVLFWHPEAPVVLRERGVLTKANNYNAPDIEIPLKVHEVEIRLGAARHETFTVILRLKADRAFIDECLAKSRFGYQWRAFEKLQVPWDDGRPFDIELHYTRTMRGIPLLSHLNQMRKTRQERWQRERDDDDTIAELPPFEFDKIILAALADKDERNMSEDYVYVFRSVHQTLADGTVIGFDYQDVDALEKRIEERYAPPAPNPITP